MVLRQPEFAVIASGVMSVTSIITIVLASFAIKYYFVEKDTSTGKKYTISASTFGGVTIIALLLYKLFK